MAKQIKVIMVEAFTGQKYIVRIDKHYKSQLADLFERLMGNNKMGSIAVVSIRFIDVDKYKGVLLDPELGRSLKNGEEKDDGIGEGKGDG